MSMPTLITKTSGLKEPYEPAKIEASLSKIGATPLDIKKTLQEVGGILKPNTKSTDLYRCSLSVLRQYNPYAAARYSLKRAIMELGPGGFVFEKYISRVLQNYGYKTEVGVKMFGKCVSQEIDIVAHTANKKFMVECKYHNVLGTASDLKVMMYSQARFEDVRTAAEAGNFDQAWLVTNTRVTSEAIKYAQCMNIKILAWQYPTRNSLEQIIDKKNLYPITILPSMTRQVLNKMLNSDLVMAEDLLRYTAQDMQYRFKLKDFVAKSLERESRMLCS